MTHEVIYKKFKEIFPNSNDIAWIPNGPNSIQLTFDNDKIFVFSYTSDMEWGFQTAKFCTTLMKENIELRHLKLAREKIDALEEAWDRLISTKDRIDETREALDNAWERSIYNHEK